MDKTMVIDRVNISVTAGCVDLLSKVHDKWVKEKRMCNQDFNFIIVTLAEREFRKNHSEEG